MQHTVVGLFDDREEAQDAISELMENGFTQEDIDLSNRRMGTDTDTDIDTAADSTTGASTGIGDRIANFFNSLFGDDEETNRSYTYAANEADAILTVHADSRERAEQAREIMDDNGAIDVNTRGAQYGRSQAGMNVGDDSEMDTEANLPVVEERLDVGKREVERGGARIHSRIVERPVEESVRLREEHVTVNRRPVDREVTDADRQHFQPGEMVITERAEVPIVGKEARVVEEVEVGKQVTEREETVHDTVRSTQVEVEDLDEDTGGRARGARP